MKIYHILLALLILQVIFFLPFQRNYEVRNDSLSAEDVYRILATLGLGPAIIYPAGWASFTEMPSGSNGYFSQVYFAFYLGNSALNVVLAACVYITYKLKNE